MNWALRAAGGLAIGVTLALAAGPTRTANAIAIYDFRNQNTGVPHDPAQNGGVRAYFVTDQPYQNAAGIVPIDFRWEVDLENPYGDGPAHVTFTMADLVMPSQFNQLGLTIANSAIVPVNGVYNTVFSSANMFVVVQGGRTYELRLSQIEGRRHTVEGPSGGRFGNWEGPWVLRGSTPVDPFLADLDDGAFSFSFDVAAGSTVYIDPIVATGYDYVVDAGPNMTSVLLPTGLGDNLYDLLIASSATGACQSTGIVLEGGVAYNFTAGGVPKFCIRGIEVGDAPLADDADGFITGLTFASDGTVNMRQVPLPFDTDGGSTSIPEPESLALLAPGLLGLHWLRRRRAA